MDEIDKKSVKYFMQEMTQKEFEELFIYRPPSSVVTEIETQMTARDRHEFNKIKYNNIQIENDKETEWIDWQRFTPPDDVKGIFIKYEDGFVDCDRYDYENKKRKYRNSKIIGWRFMERRNKNEKSIQCNV